MGAGERAPPELGPERAWGWTGGEVEQVDGCVYAGEDHVRTACTSPVSSHLLAAGPLLSFTCGCYGNSNSCRDSVVVVIRMPGPERGMLNTTGSAGQTSAADCLPVLNRS